MAFAPPPLICGFHLGKSMCSNTNTESRFLVDSSVDQSVSVFKETIFGQNTMKKKRKKKEKKKKKKNESN